MAVGIAKTISETYKALVGRLQGATEFYMKSTGYFVFYDTEYSGLALRNFLRAQYTKTTLRNSAGVMSLMEVLGSSPPVLNPGYGTYALVVGIGASNASLRLPIPALGDILVLNGQNMLSIASIYILASGGGAYSAGLTGCSLAGLSGQALSGITFPAQTIALSHQVPTLKLVCLATGEWTVVERSVTCVECPST